MEPQQFQEILRKMDEDDREAQRIWDSTPELSQANRLALNPETKSEGIAKLVDLATN
jgi:hypothetical protein